MGRVVIDPAEVMDDFPELSEVQAQEWIESAIQLAAIKAPCILSDSFQYDKAAKKIILQAIARWLESGSGALTSGSAGPFSFGMDTRVPRTVGFSDREIGLLREMCGISTSQAFTIDTTPRRRSW